MKIYAVAAAFIAGALWFTSPVAHAIPFVPTTTYDFHFGGDAFVLDGQMVVETIDNGAGGHLIQSLTGTFFIPEGPHGNLTGLTTATCELCVPTDTPDNLLYLTDPFVDQNGIGITTDTPFSFIIYALPLATDPMHIEIFNVLQLPDDFGSLTISASVPEPSTWAMMLIGFAGLGFVARRRAVSAIA